MSPPMAKCGLFTNLDRGETSQMHALKRKPRRLLLALLWVAALGTLASTQLACQGQSKPIETLLGELGHDDWLLRRNATEALGRAGSKAIPALQKALKHQRARVRLHAVEALTVMGSKAKKAMPELTGMLKDSNALVRSRAAEAIGSIGKSAANKIATLVDILQDKDPQVRRKVVQSLARLDPKLEKTGQVLQNRLADPDARVVIAAAKAIGKQSKDTAQIQLAINALRKTLRDSSPWIRAMSAFAIGHLKAKAKPATKALIKALSDKNDIVRQNAADALGSIGKDAVKHLLKAFSTEKPRLRYYVVYSIGKMGKEAESASSLLETYYKKEKSTLVKSELLRAINHIKGKRTK